MSNPSLYPFSLEDDDKFTLSIVSKISLESKLQSARDRVVASEYSPIKESPRHIREATLHLTEAAAILGYDLVRKA